MCIIMLLAAFMVALPSYAETSLVIGVATHHFIKGNYNNNNRLIALEHNKFVVGHFQNSYYKSTSIVGYRFDKRFTNFSIGALVGASYGYDNCVKGADYSNGYHKRLCPAIVPYVQLPRYGPFKVDILFPSAFQATSLSVEFTLP